MKQLHYLLIYMVNCVLLLTPLLESRICTVCTLLHFVWINYLKKPFLKVTAMEIQNMRLHCPTRISTTSWNTYRVQGNPNESLVPTCPPIWFKERILIDVMSQTALLLLRYNGKILGASTCQLSLSPMVQAEDPGGFYTPTCLLTFGTRRGSRWLLQADLPFHT